MSRNGSGIYSLATGNPVVTGSTISSTWANASLSDIATALTQSIASDGQTTITNNLPMGNYAHTGVADATVRTMYASAGQVQDSTFTYLTSMAGTDTMTALASLGMSAYATGQRFSFIAPTTNTGACTLNINSIGIKSITKNGSTALVAGDITSGYIIYVIYDGTQFQIVGLSNRAALGANTDITSLSSPAIGAATATTQVRTDNSTKVATTAMVQSVGLNAATLTNYATSTTITNADLGKHIYLNAATAQTITLPSAATCPIGSILSFTNIINAGAWTIARAGASLIYALGQTGVTSIILNPSDSVQLITDGTNWVQVTGSNGLGTGQTWTNVLVTPGRALSTTYTNSTGKPIYVAVQVAVTATTTMTAIVGGITIASYAAGTIGVSGQAFYFVVPNNVGYSISSSATALVYWSELR